MDIRCVTPAIRERPYEKRDEPYNDDAQIPGKSAGYTRQGLAAYDTIEYKKAFQAEHVKEAGDDGSKVSATPENQFEHLSHQEGLVERTQKKIELEP